MGVEGHNQTSHGALHEGRLGEFNEATIYKGVGRAKESRGMMRLPWVSTRGSHHQSGDQKLERSVASARSAPGCGRGPAQVLWPSVEQRSPQLVAPSREGTPISFCFHPPASLLVVPMAEA